MIVITFLVCALIAYLLFYYKIHIEKYKDIEKLPGPSSWDIIHFYISRSSDGIIAYLQTLNKKYGPIVKVWTNPLKPTIITTDLEFLEKIFKSSDLFYSVCIAQQTPLLRNGLATTKSRELWRNDKQIVSKALTSTYTSQQLTIYNRKYDEFIEKINENLGKPINIQPLLYRILAEISIKSLNDPQIKMTAQDVDEYINNRSKFMDLLLEKMNSTKMVGILHKFTQNYKLILKSTSRVVKVVEELLRRHKSIPEHLRQENNLYYIMMDSGIPDDRVIDNINSVIGAAYDTSTLPLSLTLYELGKRPDLQKKVLDEVISVVGHQSPSGFTLDQLNNMTYLNCVVKESVRLFFPVPFLDRLLTADFNVKNMKIPKDTRVIFHAAEILKSEEYFENSNVFIPERFLPENFNEIAKKAYVVAFGFGFKACSGKHLAYSTMKLFLAKIVREFEISVDKDHHIQWESDVFFRSINGIPVVFRKRVYN